MAFWVRAAATLGSGVVLAMGTGACGGADDTTVAPVAVRAGANTVEAWRDRWRPEAETFWDHIEAWESATDAGRSDPTATANAAPAIVAAGTEWKAALADAHLPGDITADATMLAGAIDTTVATWDEIGACGSDAACVEAHAARAQEDLYDIRSAQFALRP